jgi:uncharacterized protein
MHTDRFAPTAVDKRIAFIDILRGIALFGILASDMIGLSSPDTHFAPSIIWTDPVSRVVALLLDVLVSEKFITIFAILFGMGFAIQMERAEKRGINSLPNYRRRLVVLALFGLANGLFVWAGDILFTYAIFGFLLLLFRKRSNKTILWWAVGIQCAMFLLSLLTMSHGKSLPADQISEIQRTIELYSHGTWSAIQQARTNDFIERHIASLPLLIPFIFPRFLFGLWLWRIRFVQNINQHKPLLRKVCFWGILIGIAGETTTAIFSMGDMGPLRVLCIPLLATGYSAGIALLVLSGAFSRLFSAFAALGRTSLTNYLFQRALCTILFYSYGFGLFGSFSPLYGLALTAFIYAFEFIVSDIWLKKFQFGPMEWIWRSITYLRPQEWKARAGTSGV